MNGVQALMVNIFFDEGFATKKACDIRDIIRVYVIMCMEQHNYLCNFCIIIYCFMLFDMSVVQFWVSGCKVTIEMRPHTCFIDSWYLTKVSLHENGNI